MFRLTVPDLYKVRCGGGGVWGVNERRVFLHGTRKRQTVVSFLTAVLEAVEDPGGEGAMPLRLEKRWPPKAAA